jgi:hypothetical protein
VLHQQSTAVEVIERSNAGLVLKFDGENGLSFIKASFLKTFQEWLDKLKRFSPDDVDGSIFESYSAKTVTQALVNLLNRIPN